ncbi:MAG: DNA repair protein RecO [Spirochaetes bacterium]|nr:DNA repair protein RecO [Spirochaetota bacterium]
MNRNDVFRAVILTNRRIGEIHRLVTMLAEERGLVRAMAHGAYSKRGKLKGTTTPFTYGTCYLYTNPVKEQHKITDFDVVDDFAAVKEHIERFYTASLWAETILKSYGAGDEYGQGTGEVLTLLVTALEALASVPDDRVTLVSLQFLWRYVALNGVQPSLAECSASGRPFAAEEVRYFGGRTEGVVAGEYADPDAEGLAPGVARYLEHTASLSFDESLRVGMASESRRNARRFVHTIVEQMVEGPLNTLQTAGPILRDM